MSVGNPIAVGGGGMWVLLAYLAVAFPLVWGFGASQVMALIRWNRMRASLERFAGERDAAGLADHLDGKAGRGVMGDVLAAAARAVLDGEGPSVIMDGARATVDRRLPASSPFKVVLCVLSLALGPLAPLVLGTMFRVASTIELWGVVAMDNPFQRCRFLELALKHGEYPFWLGVIVCGILTVPALVAVFMQLNALAARRRRDDVLGLVESLLGRSRRPATGSLPGLAAFAGTVLFTAGAGWVLVGPPVKDLAAPRLHDTCVPVLEYRDVRVPVHDGSASGLQSALTLIVTRSDVIIEDLVFHDMELAPGTPAVVVESRRVTDLVEGRPGAALGSDGVTVEPLDEMLEEIYQKDLSQCPVLDCSDQEAGSILAIIADDVPVETAAAILATARRSRDRSVFVLVRTGPPSADPRTLAGMLEDVKRFASMKCVEQCSHGALEVKEVGELPAGGTFGEFLAGVEGSSFDLAAR